MVAKLKIKLRDRMRARRLTLTAEEVRTGSAAIMDRLPQVPGFQSARRVLAYVSHGNEVMTHDLIVRLLAEGREVGVPVFDPSVREYRASLIVKFPEDLVEGQLHILEPRPDRLRLVGLDHFAAVLVPGLAFDERGSRLGRGKGYYDRLLAGAPGAKIGLAYDFQVVNEVPIHAHDVPMDFLVTETRLITCRRNQS